VGHQTLYAHFPGRCKKSRLGEVATNQPLVIVSRVHPKKCKTSDSKKIQQIQRKTFPSKKRLLGRNICKKLIGRREARKSHADSEKFHRVQGGTIYKGKSRRRIQPFRERGGGSVIVVFLHRTNCAPDGNGLKFVQKGERAREVGAMKIPEFKNIELRQFHARASGFSVTNLRQRRGK